MNTPEDQQTNMTENVDSDQHSITHSDNSEKPESVYDAGLQPLNRPITHSSFTSAEFEDAPGTTYDEYKAKIEEEYPNFQVTLTPEEMPVNWSTTKKISHTIAFGVTTFASQFGASMISPAGKYIQDEFKVGREVTVLVFSIYVLGNMVGPMIFAPLSEVTGRKIGVFVPCFFAGLWLIFCANVSSIAGLVIFRFIAGVFAAAPIVSSGGALGDLWRANQRASALVLYAMCIIVGSAAAPTVGALLSQTGSYGWRWTCWLNGLLQMIIPIVNLIFLSESFVPILEKQKAKRLRLETGIWDLHAELDSWKLTVEEFFKIHCMRPILMFATPILFVMVMYSSFVYGLLFLAIATVGMEFQQVHNFSYVASYCPLFAIFVGFAVGCVINIFNSRRYARIAAEKGKAEPEERLPAMMVAGWFMPCGLFIYGWCMKPNIHWFVPIIGIAFMGGGISIVFQGCLVYIVDVYTKYAASGIAANTLMRSVFGGVFPLFAVQMFTKMGVHWAASVLGFVGVLLWPMSWIFYYTGPWIRQFDPYEKLLH